MFMNVKTRFRCYQLNSAGSSFSYFSGNQFTLVEARLNETNLKQILKELTYCKKKKIDTLHITSWDRDHCAPSELLQILELFEPARIEMPGYDPHTPSGEESQRIIMNYKDKLRANYSNVKCVAYTPAYISTLENASSLAYKDIIYNPKVITECSNDNSTIQLFRSGAFNVLSLGDVESNQISSMLTRCETILTKEVDIMILAHHGANNGFTTMKFLKHINPQIAVCSSDFDNQYDHPSPEIRSMLYDRDIPVYTTKKGDILVYNEGENSILVNFKADSSEISSKMEFKPKKCSILKNNIDTIRNRYEVKEKYW